MENNRILDEEVFVEKRFHGVSKTNLKGDIIYVNEDFVKMSDFCAVELLGSPHNIVRHPDMPKIIFKKLWDNLKKEKGFNLVLKNKTKKGSFYWVINTYSINKNQDEVAGFTSHSRIAPKSVVQEIKPFYEDLIEIETQKNDETSNLYFDAYLREEKDMSYNDYVKELLLNVEEKDIGVKHGIGKKLNWFFFSEYE